MTKTNVFNIIKELVHEIEQENGYVAQFYDFKDLNDSHYGKDYDEQKEKFFTILKEALDK